MSDSTGAFVHLAGGQSAVGVVKETLRRLRRDEGVVGTQDAYAEGPLRDADAGGDTSHRMVGPTTRQAGGSAEPQSGEGSKRGRRSR